MALVLDEGEEKGTSVGKREKREANGGGVQGEQLGGELIPSRSHASSQCRAVAGAARSSKETATQRGR